MPPLNDTNTRPNTYGAGHVQREDLCSGLLDAHHTPKLEVQNAGIPFVIMYQTVTSVTNKDFAIPKGMKVIVYDIVCYLTGTGGAADTIKAQKLTSAAVATDISDAIDCNAADKAVKRAGTIDDAQNELDGTAGDSLRIVQASDALARVFVYCVRIPN